MTVVGLDIGTTTLSAVAAEGESGRVLHSVTWPNRSFLPGLPAGQRRQDPAVILNDAREILKTLQKETGPAERIGVTGQMHGILYVDRGGEAVSPLFTWQDGCGDWPVREGVSYCDEIRQKTGYAIATGMGCATHYYLQRNGLLPAGAKRLCTIGDYVAMKLAGQVIPRLHLSNAASLGLYDCRKKEFDAAAFEALGFDADFFPRPESAGEKIGSTPEGAAVALAIGDNQASYWGSVEDPAAEILVNIGTGAQISCYADQPLQGDGWEVRPLDGDAYLLVASSLCGGRAYAALENFFRQTAALAGADGSSLYARMDAAMEDYRRPAREITVVPTFSGTRADPGLTGAVTGLTLENFTPLDFIDGMVRGIAGELLPAYHRFQETGAFHTLRAAGNAVRRNAHFRRILTEEYGMPVQVVPYPEEAARGAARFAAGLKGSHGRHESSRSS